LIVVACAVALQKYLAEEYGIWNWQEKNNGLILFGLG
jgi:hypothetical protein